jgi:hypothetical protein
MSEAYWLGGGRTPVHALAESLHQVGVNPAWIEETCLLGDEEDAVTWPGMVFPFPLPARAASALRGLQHLVAALRHGEREWALFCQVDASWVEWCALASVHGVGRHNVLPRARLWDLPPLARQVGALSEEALLAWLEASEVPSQARGHVFWLDDSRSFPPMAKARRFTWPGVSLPGLLSTWAYQAEAEEQAPVMLLVAATSGGWVGLAIELI